MNNKVSDFKLAASIIRFLCEEHKVKFVDAPICFDRAVENVLFIGNPKNISHTIFRIVYEYINHSSEITGVEFFSDSKKKEEFFFMLGTNLRSLVCDENVEEESHSIRLYQMPMIWIMLKNLICPIFNKVPINFKMIFSNTPYLDLAQYIDKGKIINGVHDESFIFCNIINNKPVQQASIFVESLRAHDLTPIETIKIIYDSDLYDKYRGVIDIAFDSENDIIDFEATVLSLLGVRSYGIITKKLSKLYRADIKTAQMFSSGNPTSASQFWYLGVLEKMIEPTRGSDWSVYKNLQPYANQFWTSVQQLKEKRIKEGKEPGIPFDLLLRLKTPQTVGYKTDPTQTIQGLLASDRIW